MWWYSVRRRSCADPLADAGRQILLAVGADGIDDGDEQDSDTGEFKRGHFVGAKVLMHPLQHLAVVAFGVQNIVEHNFQRPWLQQVSRSFSQHGNEPKQQWTGVRPEKLPDRTVSGLWVFGPVTCESGALPRLELLMCDAGF